MNLSIISLIVLVIVVAIGFIKKVNLGFLSIGVAFFLGTVGGMSAKDIAAGFSSSMFVTLVGVTFLFGMASNNGTLELFSKKIVALVGKTIHLMGFDGKSIINPRQIAPVHKIYTPSQKEIIFAQKVVKEIDEKKALGIGVFTVDGKMIDIAFYDGAKRTIELAKASGVLKEEC